MTLRRQLDGQVQFNGSVLCLCVSSKLPRTRIVVDEKWHHVAFIASSLFYPLGGTSRGFPRIGLVDSCTAGWRGMETRDCFINKNGYGQAG